MSARARVPAQDPVVIVSAVRTPLGGFQGALAGLSAPQLGAVAIRAAVERAQLDAALVQELLMGCVLPAGLGQAPARQAALGAGLPLPVACTVVSKVCGSGMKAVMLAHDQLRAESADVVVAGGMESMSNAPYLLPKARSGLRMGHAQVVDHMFLDGLEDSYGDDDRGRLMGSFAEDCADRYGVSRSDQDSFAISSTERAHAAQAAGAFDWEMAPVVVEGREGAMCVDRDELPGKARLDKVPTLKAAFRADGTVTAANASAIADGAAALLLTRASVAAEHGLRPLARVLGCRGHAQEPKCFTTAPVGAITRLLDHVGWHADEVDLWEINEAFAVVTLVAMRALGLRHERVNIHGGACALGHPIGASGARILVTLLSALKRQGLKRGVAALCIGGGEATAIAIEAL